MPISLSWLWYNFKYYNTRCSHCSHCLENSRGLENCEPGTMDNVQNTYFFPRIHIYYKSHFHTHKPLNISHLALYRNKWPASGLEKNDVDWIWSFCFSALLSPVLIPSHVGSLMVAENLHSSRLTSLQDWSSFLVTPIKNAKTCFDWTSFCGLVWYVHPQTNNGPWECSTLICQVKVTSCPLEWWVEWVSSGPIRTEEVKVDPLKKSWGAVSTKRYWMSRWSSRNRIMSKQKGNDVTGR